MGCNSSQDMVAVGHNIKSNSLEDDAFVEHEGDRGTVTATTRSVASAMNSTLGDSNESIQQFPHSPCFKFSDQQQQHVGISSSFSDVSFEDKWAATVVPVTEFNNDVSLVELTDLQPFANGGFCIICSCLYRGQHAVLKMPRPKGAAGAVEDLLAEIDIYKRISEVGGHVNMARAFGAGSHDQQGQPVPFLVLELVAGGSLAQSLENRRPLTSTYSNPLPRLAIGLEIANAVAFLHNEAIPGGWVLHRDLKPANIGLCEKGHVKVFDLGLSVVLENRGGINDKYEMSGQAGSKRFMAPEVCQGLPYNEKVDVYSFSIVLWELCSLRKPFAGMSVEDHYRQVAEQGHRPPLDPRWPPALRNLLEKSWHTNPDARPSMVEVRDTLRHIIADW